LVLHQYNKNMLLLLGAVYYREQRFAEQGCVVVACQVSSISILAQCLTSASLEQYLIRNLRIIFDHHTSSIFLQCPLPIITIANTKHDQQFSVKQTHSRQQQLFKVLNKNEVITRIRTVLFFSQLEGI